jgi:hypothetical protein
MRIYKYPIEVESRQIIYMPMGAKILSVGTQGELGTKDRPNSQMPVLFAEVDELVKGLEIRVFRIVTTGEVYNTEGLEFIGTTFVDWYTAHVFEVIEGNIDPIEDRYQSDMADIREQYREKANA